MCSGSTWGWKPRDADGFGLDMRARFGYKAGRCKATEPDGFQVTILVSPRSSAG